MNIEPGTGTGYGATEAPRGLLYHRYAITNGVIAEAGLDTPNA